MTPVDSTIINSIGYDNANKTLHANFKSGTLYHYFDVSPEEYATILTDKSVGSKLRRVMAEKEYKKQ